MPEEKKKTKKSKEGGEEKKKKPKSGGGGGGGAASFDQRQMQEFKEAFGVLDANKDGIIDSSDLKSVYMQLGQIPSDSQIDDMLAEAPGRLDFATFLTLFGEKLTGTDPEDVIVNAFRMWDPIDKGTITEEQLKKILQSKKGDPFDEDELREMMKGKPPIDEGVVDYKAFAKAIVGGAAEELAKASEGL